MSLSDVDQLIAQIGPVMQSIEDTLTADDSLLAQMNTAVEALLAKIATGSGSTTPVDTTAEETTLKDLLAKSQAAQAEVTTQAANLQAAVTAATPQS